MIDRKTLTLELEWARSVRSEAEDACCAIEELLWEMRYPRTWRRLAQVDTDEPEALAHKH